MQGAKEEAATEGAEGLQFQLLVAVRLHWLEPETNAECLVLADMRTTASSLLTGAPGLPNKLTET
jgi:hypothetical protein